MRRGHWLRFGCVTNAIAGQAGLAQVFGDRIHERRRRCQVENMRRRIAPIVILLAKPLGLKEVINPLPASGGADKESRDQARKNAPLTVTALDR